MSLVFALLVTAFVLRAVYAEDANVWARLLSMSLCALAKPPQIAFILLETMRSLLWRTTVTGRH